MKTNLDTWDKWHTENLTEQARTLIFGQQGEAGKGGLMEISAIEKDFLLDLNEYSKIYKEALGLTPDQKINWDREREMLHIEGAIKTQQKEFDDVAKIWY